MKIKITKNRFDAFIIYLMLYYIFFGIWIGTGVGAIQNIIVGLCIIRILYLSMKKISPYSHLFIYIFILAIYFCFNYFAYNSNRNYGSNMAYICGCWSVVIYFAVLLQTKQKWLESFLVRLSTALNIYMCINIIVMFLQLNESYFLIDKSRIPVVVYYPDYIAGFFGINGTHRLTLFCILFICLNMYVFRFGLKRNYKRIPMFVAIVSVCMFALSTQNDNNMFFILYPLFALFLYAILYKINYRRLGKILGIVLGSFVLIGIVVSINNVFLQEIGERLNDIIQVYIFKNDNVWDERTELLTYAMVQGKGTLFGSGIGSVKMYSDESIGTHWGMNSLMTFTYFMGIVPLILYVVIHILVLTRSLFYCEQRKVIVIRVGMVILLGLLIQYCQVLSEVNLMILFCLICSVILMSVMKREKEKGLRRYEKN